MSKRFMPGMIMLDSIITPGSSTDFNYGQGTKGDSYFDPDSEMNFTYRNGYRGLGWYGEDDETFFPSIQDRWIHNDQSDI